MQLIQGGDDAAQCLGENGCMGVLHGKYEGVLPDRVSFDGEGGECKHCRLEKVLVDCFYCQPWESSQNKVFCFGGSVVGWVSLGWSW